MADTGAGNIKVVVRCRPLNSREINRGSKGLIKMSGNQTTLEPPENTANVSSRAIEKGPKSFAFDKSYWSAGPRDAPEYASQQTLYNDLGKELLDHSFQGFNCCIFAYGQTGSGKSYSMMGYGEDKGIIPLTCQALFDQIKTKTSDIQTYRVEVSFYEIYNEKIRDLLNPKNKGNLRIREHPSTGPYVEDLAKLAVESYEDIERLMDEGNKARTVAATNMNETSSRSHSVFTVLVTQKKKDEDTGMEGEKVSRINLVDLAGSERANSTGATGSRLKEGANINRSLTTLGKVISALAQASSVATPKKKLKEDFIPYRDSALTWLLKDSIGGNSKTCMIAAISPADYEETLSTLRYADQAKKIKNRAVVNEDPNAKLIRELKEELYTLRNRISGGSVEATFDPQIPPEKQVVQYKTSSGEIKTVTKADLADRIEQSEKLMTEVNQTWEEKLQKTQEIQKARESALEELGITIEKNLVGVHTPRKMPHLVNLNEDPLASECLLFCIKKGQTTVGNSESSATLDIRLSGRAIKDEHCYFEHNDEPGSSVTLMTHEGAITMVNGHRLKPGEPKQLKSGYRIIMGDFHVFRFNNPEEVRQERDKVRASMAMSPLGNPDSALTMTPPSTRPDSPSVNNSNNIDWAYARREALYATLNGTDVDLDKLNDQDLDKLYSDISKARTMRKGTSLGRSESRMSFLESVDDDDDTSSTDPSTTNRPFSTDNTSIESTLLSNGGAPDSTPSNQIDNSNSTSEDIATKEELQSQLDLVHKDMQKKLYNQKRRYERKVKKLASIGGNLPEGWWEGEDDDFEPLTDHQTYLANKVLSRWKSTNTLKLSEHVLSLAILCKEANVISRELGKRVTYQFTIIGPTPFPTFSKCTLESIAGMTDFDETSDPALLNNSNSKPCLAIKVLDHRHEAAYIWSIEKLKDRLDTMRNLYSFIDKPSYSEHLNWEDPFYDTPPPSYSHIGFATVPLLSIFKRLDTECTPFIFSTFSENSEGTCRVRFHHFKLQSPSSSNSNNDPTTPTNGTNSTTAVVGSQDGTNNGFISYLDDLPNGSKLSFELVVDKVSGALLKNFGSILCQVNICKFLGVPPSSPDTDSSSSTWSMKHDETFASEPVDISQSENTCNLRLRKTISFEITSSFKELFKSSSSGYGYIELFAQVRPLFLRKIEQWDVSEALHFNFIPTTNNNNNNGSDDTTAVVGSDNGKGNMTNNHGHFRRISDGGNATVIHQGRLAETEMVSEQHHDVRAVVQVTEMGADGKHNPAELVATNNVDRGAFHLHQGLQRRLYINLSHNSGRQWPWSKLASVSIGNVRLLDSRGIVHGDHNEELVDLNSSPRSKSTSSSFQPDGTSMISFESPWDSSMHDSPFLNRTTPSGSRVLLKLTWSVEASNCEKPVEFSMDIALVIQGRESRASEKFKRLVSQNRVMNSANALFSVTLVPSSTIHSSEIWRRDTSKTFVRGEESLGNWTPRGVSLVRERVSLASRARLMADVCATQAFMSKREREHEQQNQQETSNDVSTTKDPVKQEELLRRIIDLWTRGMNTTILTATEAPAITSPQQGPLLDASTTSSVSSTTSSTLDSSVGKSRTPRSTKKKMKDRKFNATTCMIPISVNVQCRGYLDMLRDPTSDKWTKLWFVLSRPYLYIYENSDELEEVGVINLSSVKVDHNQELETMLQRNFVFAVFTQQNAYFFQANVESNLEKWLLAIDPSYGL